MVSLAELQNSKALLKPKKGRDVKVSRAEVGRANGARDELLTDSQEPSEVSTGNVPLISLQALATARVGLHKIARPKKPAINGPFVISTTKEYDDDGLLPAFAKRKELFNRPKEPVSRSVSIS